MSSAEQNAPKMGAVAPKMGATAQALFGKTRRTLLALLFGHPEQSYHMRAVAAIVGSGQGAVQRELLNLTNAGLITRAKRGRQIYYQANQAHPVFADLRALIVKTVGVADVLRSALLPLAERITVAFIFGSMARGTVTEASDVDVMIIGEVSFGQVVSALHPIEDELGREVNPSVYPAEEFAQRLRAGAHFLTSVVRGDMVFLIGGKDELDRLVQTGLVDGA